MDWKKFKAIATLFIFCADEICDYVSGNENVINNTTCLDRIDDAMGAAQMMIDKLQDNGQNK